MENNNNKEAVEYLFNYWWAINDLAKPILYCILIFIGWATLFIYLTQTQ